MSFREHVADLLARPDIPVRHALSCHGLFPLWLQAFSLTHALHDRKRQRTFHAFVDQIDHDIIPGTDGSRDRCFPCFYKFLRISQPHVGSVGQTGNTDKI